MDKAKVIKKNTKAPDFILDDQNDKPFRLSDYKGKKVLLSFHPLAWTSVCSKQMKSLEANIKNFNKVNTVAVGISVDSSPSKKYWAKDLGIKKTRLLADFWPHGSIAQAYGIFDEQDGVSERSNIIVDEDQKVVFVKVYPRPQLPDIKEILRHLE